MNNKFSWKNFNLLPKKQQRAVYTLIFSLLGFLLVVVIAAVLLFTGGKEKPESSSASGSESTSGSGSSVVEDPITSDEYDGIKLEEAENTDKNYLKETLFIGDSNTERLMEYGAISIDNYVGKSGLSITGAASEKCVYFKNDTKSYTIPEAVAKMKPRRVVITLGTNDSGDGMTTENFLKTYESFIKSIQEAYPHCDVIVNSVPPVAKQRSYKNIDMDKINAYNKALASMAKEKGFKFLNSSEGLRGSDGYGKSTYFSKDDGIHLVQAGARIMVDYARTHPHVAEDRRPDTKDIPTRRPAPASTSTPSSTPGSSSETENDITATYDVKVESGKAMGYLKSEKFDSKTSYTHTFNAENKNFTVTAVANDGFVFDGWSDGVKEAKRTDESPKKSIKVTANFRKIVPLSLKVDKESTLNINVGESVTCKATVSGDGGDSNKVVWKLDGVVKDASSTSYTFKFDKEGTFTITASYEGVKNPVTITVKVTKKVDPTTITISGATSAKVGDGTLTYTASVTGTGAEAKNVKWTVNGEDYGTKSTMTFPPDKEGTFKIVASLNGVSKELTLTVSKKEEVKPTTVSISASAGTVTVGDTVTFTASVTGTGADAKNVSWTVGGVNRGTGASISYKPDAAGTFEVSATLNGVTSNKLWLTVNAKPDTNITISISGPSEAPSGSAVNFTATTNANVQDIQWFVDGIDSTQRGAAFQSTFPDGSFTVYAVAKGVKSNEIRLNILASSQPPTSSSTTTE